MTNIEKAKNAFEEGIKNTSSKKLRKIDDSILKTTKKGTNGQCHICGYESEWAGIQHHHIVPERIGGSEQKPLCGTCHLEVEGYYAEKECTSEDDFRSAFTEFKIMKRSESPFWDGN